MKREPAASFDPKVGLMWRGYFKSPEDMERLAVAFESGPYPDAQYAAQCRAALALYGAHQQRQER